jgi:hypothetical protein
MKIRIKKKNHSNVEPEPSSSPILLSVSESESESPIPELLEQEFNEYGELDEQDEPDKQDEPDEIIRQQINEQLRKILDNSKKNHKEEIVKQSTLKYAHIYCKTHQLSGQSSGPLIEYYMINKYHMIKNKASECIGDCSKNGQNIEIKISLGGDKTHSEFNYVQIRFNHDIDIYLLTAYYVNEDNIDNNGELYIFSVDKNSMRNIIYQFGQYAHGTKKKLGEITMNDLEDITNTNTKEYCIRPKYGDECWNTLLQFRIHESDI